MQYIMYIRSVKNSMSIKSMLKGEQAMGDLAGVAISITVFLVVIGYILAPVGLTSMANVNRTAAGVTTGTTNGNIWDALVPIVLAALVIGVVYFLKHEAS
jgi:hypothetical protein